MNMTNNMTKEERLKKNKDYIKILNEKNPTETKLEKQKRLSKMGKNLFDIYFSNKSHYYYYYY